MTDRKMIRVRCDYEDGRVSVALYEDGHERAGLAFVEMRERDWNAYQTHLALDSLWQGKLRELDNVQYERDTPAREAWESRWLAQREEEERARLFPHGAALAEIERAARGEHDAAELLLREEGSTSARRELDSAANALAADARALVESREVANVKTQEGNALLDALSDAIERFERAASEQEGDENSPGC